MFNNYIITFFYICIPVVSNAQYVSFKNRDIEIILEYSKQNDSTVFISNTFINRTNNTIYIKPLEDSVSYFDEVFSVPSNYIILSNGVFSEGSTAEFAAILTLLEAHDTLHFKTVLYCRNLNNKKHLTFSNDYLKPSNFDKETILLINNLIAKFPKNEENEYIMNRDSYSKYCDNFTLRIPFILSTDE